jgi:hypothetical protein
MPKQKMSKGFMKKEKAEGKGKAGEYKETKKMKSFEKKKGYEYK